ncbi:MAG: rRNA maturation RNase YbeY [Roseomonas sp.]|nr:rRNA maturation RNase YbeY [Roseomonas sp.]
MPRPEAVARRAAIAALEEAGIRGAVTVLLADDAAVKRLNGRHRAKAKPTNVLSFPTDIPGDRLRSPEGAGCEAAERRRRESQALPYLGDVALALGVVRREARQAGRRAADHLAHLVAHGALHLAGHDHLEAGEARRMERAEARVMRKLGRPNPWKEGRATARLRGAT